MPSLHIQRNDIVQVITGSGSGSKKQLMRRLEEAGFRQTFDTGSEDVYGIAHFERIDTPTGQEPAASTLNPQ